MTEHARLIPQAWADQLHAAMKPGPLTRYLLRHQYQEHTDTTAAYEAGEDVIPGDCWRACLASLLEIPIAEVPHFIHLYPAVPLVNPTDAEIHAREQHGPEWWRESVAWVERIRPGWTLANWSAASIDWPLYGEGDAAEGAPDRVIITGPSPRGNWQHAVLALADSGEIEHDPFPHGHGVRGLEPGPCEVSALVRPEWLA